MSEEKIYCYNCFKPIKEGEKTREHIPAKTLFEGYDDKYKVNRITVPACYECNQGYSPTSPQYLHQNQEINFDTLPLIHSLIIRPHL